MSTIDKPRRAKNQTVSSLDAFRLGTIYLVTTLKDCEAAKGNIKGDFFQGRNKQKLQQFVSAKMPTRLI